MILGTGICAYVQKDGNHKKVAGWGYLIDDGGSGYNLGRDALNAHFSAIDGTGEKTILTEKIEAIYPSDTQQLMSYLYRDGKKAIASFAPAVFAALEREDATAKRILERNMKVAAHIVETAAREFTEKRIPVILAGGLTNQTCVLECLKNNLSNPERFEIRKLQIAPVEGAVILARELVKEKEMYYAENRDEK